MSKAGYPYDNAPMERYFNTLKNECTNLYEFKTEEELYQAVENFPMSTTIMYARIAPTVTVRHIRHESQDKKGCPSRLLDYSKSERLAFVKGKAATAV